MHRIPLAVIISLLATLGLTGPATNARPEAPLPGPGAVYQSIELLFEATDAGNAGRIASVLRPLGRGDGWQWTREASGALEDGPPAGGGEQMFFTDVDRDGATIEADTVPSATETILDAISGAGTEDLNLKTRIVSVHADCASEHCSWARVVFERAFTRASGQRVAVPMQATALMRYQAEAPTMRIYLWHASATGPARPVAPEKAAAGKR